MPAEPHIVIGHHPELGVVAKDSGTSSVASQVLTTTGFMMLAGQRQLYRFAAAEPTPGRIRTAVSRLRAAGFRVHTDAIYDPTLFV
ncbi:hypothetical protein [Streptomyces zaomyceticus]|uniref:hypothetical protein n=1 Tax=Streptomyces zaomyceticus TaxID=68286 RepID=UPI0036AF57C3